MDVKQLKLIVDNLKLEKELILAQIELLTIKNERLKEGLSCTTEQT